MDSNDIATKQDIRLILEKVNLIVELVGKLKSNAKDDQPEIYLTSKEVLQTYKIGKTQLYNLRSKGLLPSSKALGPLLFPKSAIEKFIKEQLSNSF